MSAMRSAVIAGWLTLPWLLTACGGSAVGGNIEAKAEFVERAGAICEQSKAQADRAAERGVPSLGVGPPSARQGQRLLALALPHIQAAAEGISALTPPPGDEETIAAYLEEYRAATAELETIAADPRRTANLMAGEIEDPFVDADRMLGEYGVEKCSGDGA